MTKKNHVVNVEAAQDILRHVEAVEIKLRMLKQCVNPQIGVVNDMKLVSGLFITAQDEMVAMNAKLVKFL